MQGDSHFRMHALRITFIFAICVGVGGWLMCNVLIAIRTGVARGCGVRFIRAQNPAMFWMTVIVQAVFSFLSFYVLLILMLNYRQI